MSEQQCRPRESAGCARCGAGGERVMPWKRVWERLGTRSTAATGGGYERLRELVGLLGGCLAVGSARAELTRAPRGLCALHCGLDGVCTCALVICC